MEAFPPCELFWGGKCDLQVLSNETGFPNATTMFKHILMCQKCLADVTKKILHGWKWECWKSIRSQLFSHCSRETRRLSSSVASIPSASSKSLARLTCKTTCCKQLSIKSNSHICRQQDTWRSGQNKQCHASLDLALCLLSLAQELFPYRAKRAAVLEESSECVSECLNMNGWCCGIKAEWRQHHCKCQIYG
jgi:hypothetical protein